MRHASPDASVEPGLLGAARTYQHLLSGFTDHVFALCPFLGCRFAPRIRDLPEKKLYVPDQPKEYPTLSSFIGEKISTKLILAQWPEILRLVASIKQGTVTASLILRKLASYPRQNSLALALRELGRIERTLFTLHWLLDPADRRLHLAAKQARGERRLPVPAASAQRLAYNIFRFAQGPELD